MVRRTPDDAAWHASALSLLDTLWSLDTHMGVIRRRLAVTLGFNPSPEQVRAQAQRFMPEAPYVRRAPPACRSANAIVRAELFAMRAKSGVPPSTPVDHSAWIEPAPGRHIDPVRLVKKGAFKANKFSMIGGRL